MSTARMPDMGALEDFREFPDEFSLGDFLDDANLEETVVHPGA